MTAPLRLFEGPSEMHARAAALDWSSTPLGDPTQWPQSLRALVRTVLASRYPMLLAWGPAFTQIYNDGYSQLIGSKHPGDLGIDLRSSLAEAWDVLGPMIERVMATGVANWTPALLLPLERAGYREESYFSVSHAPAEDDDGRVVGMLAVCSEVTEVVLGERRTRLLRDLATRASGVRTVDEACRGAMEEIARHPLDVPFAQLFANDATGRPALCSGGENEVAWPLERVLAGETVVLDAGSRLGALRGGPFGDPVRHVVLLPLASGGEAPLGVVALGTSPARALDESYRSFLELLAGQAAVAIRNARAREDERRRAEALAEIDQAKTAFFSNVSHEFRTPLTLLLGPVESALQSPARTLAGDDLELVARNARRLLKLVNALLEFSRLEAGRTRLNPEPTDLAALTRDLASQFRAAAERAGIALVIECAALARNVSVDRDAWERVVLNLLSNAFKFTFSGSITVRLAREGERAVLDVSDTGVGIAASETAHVFERFRRVESARSRSHEGSGIGLALVREFARLHGGDASVTSTPGHGSTFRVWLPTDTARDAPARPFDTGGARAVAYVEETERWLPGASLPAARAHASGGAVLEGAHGARARVLLADDNADMRGYITRLLEPYVTVTTAADGAEALATAQASPPDLVLSDVMMPVMDGFALLRALRADERTATVPVVLLSARAGEEAAVEGLAAGADDYLVKPFGARELFARVRASLDLARLRVSHAEQLAARRVAETLAADFERREAERTKVLALERAAREEAERLGVLKDEFVTTVSHELRTPLTSILGWTRLLVGTTLGEARRAQGLASIDRNARVQVQLVEELLDVSRLANGKMTLAMQPVAIGALVHAAIDTVRPAAEARGVQMWARIADDAGTLVADPDRLQQVVWNLVSNAVKFTPSGGSVTVTAERGADRVVIVVQDTGRGFAPAFAPYLFERFRQAEGGSQRSHGGLGIGLSIVRSLVELHGGTVTAESAGEGLGARFTVTLPTRSGRASDPVVRTLGATPSPIPTDPRAALAGVHVLLVDDEADTRELVGVLLESHGARVTSASATREALAAFGSDRPDIVLSDIAMPGDDGYVLLARVRGIERSVAGSARVPAIALTAYARLEDRQRALAAGYDRHVAKPIEPGRLIALIREALDEARTA